MSLRSERSHAVVAGLALEAAIVTVAVFAVVGALTVAYLIGHWLT